MKVRKSFIFKSILVQYFQIIASSHYVFNSRGSLVHYRLANKKDQCHRVPRKLKVFLNYKAQQKHST
jgi:GTP-sensing pleiotropic transcriptional regulator CodY